MLVCKHHKKDNTGGKKSTILVILFKMITHGFKYIISKYLFTKL